MELARFDEHDILLTLQEAAALLRVSRATMYRLLNSGQLVGVRVGHRWRFYKHDLHRFASAQSVPAPLPADPTAVPIPGKNTATSE